MLGFNKIGTLEEIVETVRSRHAAGRRIVLTNGCFDLFHAGHVLYLQAARDLGDVLVVAVNSDRAVRELKGPGRPLCPERSRCAVLAALECVDYVTVFDEASATAVIRAFAPDVWVKGGDLSLETIPADQRQALEEMGAEIVFLPLLGGHSTSALIERARERAAV